MSKCCHTLWPLVSHDCWCLCILTLAKSYIVCHPQKPKSRLTFSGNVTCRLALQPSYRVFICWPKCSACYPDGGPDSYPELCLSKHLPSQPICSQHLQKTHIILNHQSHIPVHCFFYHDFNDWLRQMLCHPRMEDMMGHDTSPLSGGVMEDIWDVPGLYKIPGP